MSLPVTEDTPPDMLAGSMDLVIVLPNGNRVKTSIQRSTPMMDLLVQITTAHRLSPGNHSLQAIGDRGILPYKPSTPIGALDAFSIHIVDKKSNSHKRAPQVPQSFLNTFRLQVHLPRSQLFVARVTPEITVSEILNHVCKEKCLDINKYELRNPDNLDEVLQLDKSLGDYKLQEVSLVAKGNRTVSGLLSSADIINVKSSKHRQNSVCDSSLSSGSFGSRSVSPVPAVNMSAVPPQPPIRKKRRPAPKPPALAENEKKEEKTKTRSVLISHSRESSDSSGYHEASVLSESPTHGAPAGRRGSNSPPDTLPRLSNLPPSQSFTNLTSINPVPRNRLTSSVSNSSLSSSGPTRKKRAAPPPPTQAQTDRKVKASTLPKYPSGEKSVSYGSISDVSSNRSSLDYPVVETPKAKVETPVDSEPEIIAETKVEIEIPKAEEKPVKDVEVKPVPVPRPRSTISSATKEDENKKFPKLQMIRSNTDVILAAKPKAPTARKSADDSDATNEGFEGINRWKNSENLNRRDSVVENDRKREENDKIDSDVPRKTAEDDQVSRSPSSGIKTKPKLPPKPAVVLRQRSENDAFAKIRSLPSMKNENDESPVFEQRIGRWRNSESLACLHDDDDDVAVKNAWLVGDSDASSSENASPTNEPEQDEHDSLNWQYQLPPPPTDFRDANSPDCTEFGTITLTPDIYLEERKNPEKEIQLDSGESEKRKNRSVVGEPSVKPSQIKASDNQDTVKTSDRNEVKIPKPSRDENVNSRLGYEMKLSQNKTDVMNELTNVLNENRKVREKSLSVINLSSNNDSNVKSRNSLNYSRSFSIEPVTTIKNFRITTYETNGMEYNRRWSNSNELVYDVIYKNNKNLEKSCSMECIKTNGNDNRAIAERNEDVFRRPIGPVQKKLKAARRSSSTVGTECSNAQKRNSSTDEKDETDAADDQNMAVLRQQFLEFLKEKKLTNADLSMKSLEVIRNLLPQLNADKSDSRNVVVNSHNEAQSEEEAEIDEKAIDFVELEKTEAESPKRVETKSPVEIVEKEAETPKIAETHDRVKIVDVKMKNSEKPSIENNEKPTAELKKFSSQNNEPEKPDLIKRYSYQGPPSINFATWGERPKTRVVIKDEDYITQENVIGKKIEAFNQAEDKTAAAQNANLLKHRESLKKTQSAVFKKPSGVSNYELFSALPKKKEVSSIQLVHLEDEEKRRRKEESKEPCRVPIVCGVELKKGIKSEPEIKKPLVHSVSEISIKPNKVSRLNHSTSVYVNGNQDQVDYDGNKTSKSTIYNYVQPKRNAALMPVVKGFRSFNDYTSQSHVNSIVSNNNDSNSNKYEATKESSAINQKSINSTRETVQVVPPPPPPVGLINLKPVNARQVKPKSNAGEDPRSRLMEEIRNFGGLRKLKKETLQ